MGNDGVIKRENTIGLKWVLKIEFVPDGSLQNHKARLVAKGYKELCGVDFEETFSSVARFEIVEMTSLQI